MSDRSDELTESRDSRSTDDLLEETEHLLSGSEGETDVSTNAGPAEPPTDVGASAHTTADAGTASADAVDSSGSSRLGGLKPGLSAGEYFSPKAFLAIVLLFGVSTVAGGTVLPFAGGAIGMLVVAFLLGLATSKRRYLETTVAGVAAGSLSTVLTEPMLAIAGSLRTMLLVGAAIGLLASVIGYYFGRDLRDGLSRDVE